MAQSEDISFRLEQLILDGGLAPGQKIPSERQLAFRLGVSRALVREALHELQGRGVIKTYHGKGSFVASILPGGPEADDSSPLMHLYSGHSRTLYDLLEVREQLEGQAAWLAAQRATNMDRIRITRAFERLGETDPLSNAEPDHGFHQAIVEASHNPVLVHILNGLKKMMLLTVQASVANLNPREEMRQTIMKQHRRLYRAILSGRASAAQKAATSHVRFVITSLKYLEEEGAPVTRPTDAKNLHCTNIATQ
ncbi:FCD domain-containing protein [Marinobacter sp. GN3S48]|uniref:FCD domain-containing protein n=1 Tax=Marinobacter sp. GN3S48 TaxID=3382302 RepID=UPI00387B1DB4